MSEEIIRNDINKSEEDFLVLQFLNDFKAQKCLYCFQSDKKFLCQCKECGYFFCNNIHRKTSHALIHLNRCKHKKIALDPFDLELICKECRNKDVFDLYFNKDNTILCEDCIKKEDEKDFTKIIDNKKINDKILISPDIPPAANRFDSYSESLMAKMDNKILTLKNFFLPIVSLNFSKKKKYVQKYITLLENEKMEIAKRDMEEESFIFDLKFSMIDNSYIIAVLKKDKQEFIFYPRQLLLVAKATNENKSFLARVIDIDKNENKITIFFKDLDKCLKDGEYSIKEKDSLASYDRMINGLEELKPKNSSLLNRNILLLILGKEIKEDKEKISNLNEYLDKSHIPKKLTIPLLPNIQLNKSQENAMFNCFKHKLTLIKGIPGTGKSTVLSFLAYHLLRLKKTQSDKILICAPSNKAVDNISYYLQKLHLKFIRVLSLEKEMTDDVDKTNSLEDLIKQEIEKDIEKNPKLKKVVELSEKRVKYGQLKGEDYEKYKKIIEQYQYKIINSSPIILSTLNNSADPRLNRCNFPIVIIDEATQALEPDCLLSLLHKAQMAVLIGDEKQLGPTIISQESITAGLGVSMFDRLCFYYKGSDFISTLNEQYRMHSSLYEFSNKHFYNNQIKTHEEIQLDENVIKNFPWPNKDIPTTFFYNIVDTEKCENYSYYNDKEIYHVYGVVHKLIKAGVKVEDIGIITPYNAQKYKLYEKFSNDKYDNLKIESVDGFQGMEKDYIIISTVRSNVSGKIGFLNEPRRLNVALTRPKKGAIILGNAECLSKKNGIWRDLVSFYYSKKLIFQGPLSNLVPVPMEEIFINDIESDKEEECEKIKIEKHKEVKKEIITDYFNSGDPAPIPKKEIKNEIKEEDEIIIESKSTAEEEKESEEDSKDSKKNKKKNKDKNSNKNIEEEEEKEIKENSKDCKKNKNKDKNKNRNKNSNKNSEEVEEKVIEEKKKINNKKSKKEKDQKNKIEIEEKEDRKNKKKGNKKYLNDSSSDNDEKKSKKNGKKKAK